LFGDIGDVPLGFEWLLRHVQPFDHRLTGGRLDEVQEEIDRRSLARAVRAEQTKDFARLYLQIERIERDRAVVMFGQVDRFEHRWNSSLTDRQGKSAWF